MSHRIQALLLVAAILAAAAVLAWQYVPLNPYSMVVLPVPQDQILARAAEAAHRSGIRDPLPSTETQLERNDAVMQFLTQRHGTMEAVRQARAHALATTFLMQWHLTPEGFVAGAGERRAWSSLAPGEEQLLMRLTAAGDVVLLDHRISDSLQLPMLNDTDATMRAREGLRLLFGRFPSPASAGVKLTQRTRRVEREFTWTTWDSTLASPIRLSIVIAGDRLTHAEADLDVETAASDKSSASGLGVASVVLVIVLAVAGVIVGVRRVRAYEIQFRTGIWLGLLIALIMGTVIGVRMTGVGISERLIALGLGSSLAGGAFILLWSITDSLARESWKEKFFSIDLLLRGYLTHSRVGMAGLKALAAGIGAPVLWLVAARGALALKPDLPLLFDMDHLWVFQSSFAALLIFLQAIPSSLFLAVGLALFPISLVRVRFPSAWATVPIAFIAFVFLPRVMAGPFWWNIAICALPAIVLAVALLRMDVLSLLMMAIVAPIAETGPALVFSQNPLLASSGIALCAALAVLAIWCLFSVLSRDPAVDPDAITPAFVRYITERQRMKRELEIAAEVQQGFLPKRPPEIEGVEIAARCVPALEVGGDYYDFVPLADGRFSVVIGDVSGKGTQAAFYMTLTKGFVRAVARTSSSPAQALRQLNELFCENVERGIFISMTYAVVDVKAETVSIARAGHLPPLLREAKSGKVLPLQLAGVALGLEPGGVFDANVEERTLPFCPGDALLLCTDGFTEARNGAGEEFGDERLTDVFAKIEADHAANMLDALYHAARRFTGKAPRHDDMTMVIIRRSVA